MPWPWLPQARRGDTQRELLSLLGVADGETSSIQSGIYTACYIPITKLEIEDSHSLWLDDDMNGEPIEFKKSFVKTLRRISMHPPIV